MNLKKIIREELDDFDWVDEMDPVGDVLSFLYELDEIKTKLDLASQDYSSYNLKYDFDESKDHIFIVYDWSTPEEGSTVGMELYYKEYPLKLIINETGSSIYGDIKNTNIKTFKSLNEVYDYIKSYFGWVNIYLDLNESQDDDFSWINDISDKWEPKVGDKFICKNGFSRVSRSINPEYGGAAYKPGKIYTIKSIAPNTFHDDETVFFTEEDEHNNGVYKKATEPYFEYLNESEEDDFDWARGEVIFTINDIIGKKCTYRENNLDELEEEYNLSISQLKRGDVDLGPIRYNNLYSYWLVDRIEGDNVILNLGNTEIDYSIEEVEQYVNLGVWVLFDETGNILNDFSK